MADNVAFSEDRLFISKLGDMITLSEKRGAVYSLFLNSHECAVAQKEFCRIGFENYRFYGAFENAERQMLCVYKEYFSPEDMLGSSLVIGIIGFVIVLVMIFAIVMTGVSK